jgi:Protein of unknown function (DUF4238)
MHYSSRQLKLLQWILEEIQEHANYDRATLNGIYCYLLRSHAPKPVSDDTVLQQSLGYLQDLIQEDGLASLQQIWEHLQQRRGLALEFVTEMIDRVDRQRISDGLESFVLFLDPPLVPALLPRATLADQLRQIFSSGLPLSFPFHGSYQRPSTTYFRQFTEQEHAGQMYVLEYYSDLGVEECTIGEIANKLAASEPMGTEDDGALLIQPGNPIHFNYDKLLHLVLDSKDQIDLSFKVGITCWLLLTQSDHFDLMADRDGPGQINGKEGQAPSRFHELFECWVYFYLVESLADKQWSILKTPHHMSWVTSDKPGIVIDKREEAKQSIFSANLLRHLKGIRSFYYPLSKDYCLRLEPSTIEKDMAFSTIRVEMSSEEEVKEVNAMMGSLGKEMVIASDKQILESFRAKKYYP